MVRVIRALLHDLSRKHNEQIRHLTLVFFRLHRDFEHIFGIGFAYEVRAPPNDAPDWCSWQSADKPRTKLVRISLGADTIAGVTRPSSSRLSTLVTDGEASATLDLGNENGDMSMCIPIGVRESGMAPHPRKCWELNLSDRAVCHMCEICYGSTRKFGHCEDVWEALLRLCTDFGVSYAADVSPLPLPSRSAVQPSIPDLRFSSSLAARCTCVGSYATRQREIRVGASVDIALHD